MRPRHTGPAYEEYDLSFRAYETIPNKTGKLFQMMCMRTVLREKRKLVVPAMRCVNRGT